MISFPLLQALICPICHEPLEPGEAGFHCAGCQESFPTVEGVPALFSGAGQDIWKENKNGLALYLEAHPEARAALENTPETTLNGADLSAKASLLRHSGKEEEAVRIWELAILRSYPQAYLQTFSQQMDFICNRLSDVTEPVVDFASGRGMLLSRLLRQCKAPLLASDLSPTVLGSLLRRFPAETAAGRLFTLAFDAKAIPFSDGSLPYLTTCLGLQNIPQPEEALRELRRACGGTLFALCMFFPEEDRENQETARQHGLGGAFSQNQLTSLLEKTGWQVTPHNSAKFILPPTPKGKIIEGMGMDALPVQETTAWFSTLVCRAG